MMPRLLLLLTSLVPLLPAQLHYAGTHVHSYVPVFFDGGPDGLQTLLQFTNTQSSSVSATMSFYADTGEPMDVPLGNGSGPVWSLTLPARGLRLVAIPNAPSQTVRGWVIVRSILPIQVVALLRTRGGTALPASIEPTLPSLSFLGPMLPGTIFSAANPFVDAPVTVVATALDVNGQKIGDRRVTIPPTGRTSLTPSSLGLPDNFAGTVRLDGERRQDVFVAAAYEGNPGGAFRSVPLARIATPASHWDRVWLVYRRVLDAALRVPDTDFGNIQLRIGAEREINAFAADGRVIQINLALTDLLNESDSELAQVIGHELGHIFQQRTKKYLFNPNPEYDADLWGLVLALSAGYDPYAMAGALAKLAMVTGRSGLVSQFEDQVSGDAHTSFNTRVSTVFDTVKTVCDQLMKRECAEYKSIFHPYFPDAAPLGHEPEAAPTRRLAGADSPGHAKKLP